MIENPEPKEFDDHAININAGAPDLLQGYYSFVHSLTKSSNDIRKIHKHQYSFHRIGDISLISGTHNNRVFTT